MKLHTGVYMTTGQGAAYATSKKQKVVAKSSTEGKLIGIDDGMSQMLWTKYFLEEQGYNLKMTTLYQDNQSTILLAENGRAPSTKRIQHINNCYYFVTDCIKRGDVEVNYLPTDLMIGDFFTKPLTGGTFYRLQNTILGIEGLDMNPYKKAYSKYIIAKEKALYKAWPRGHTAIKGRNHIKEHAVDK